MPGVSCSLGVHRTSTPRSAVRWQGKPAVSLVSGQQKRMFPNTSEHLCCGIKRNLDKPSRRRGSAPLGFALLGTVPVVIPVAN
ncbi:hypothetical protein CHARACLAT_020691 [Characodon lateralis]|uniref:Uncharacterized protein n=1 Tax=Characodon lateralis TaxID=208331 RepID=A0ABU7F547_9TELE|nr:hypothetical protein [Characodon lateralis]